MASRAALEPTQPPIQRVSEILLGAKSSLTVTPTAQLHTIQRSKMRAALHYQTEHASMCDAWEEAKLELMALINQLTPRSCVFLRKPTVPTIL
jgi:hypothetical protein